MPFPSLLRDPRDRLPVLLSLLPAGAVAVSPAWWTVGLCVWWTGNTVAHQAVHRRFFRSAALERAFSLWLSLLLGVPQRLWRQRHLAHHAGRSWRWQREPQLSLELGALAAAFAAAAFWSPALLVGSYLPGLAAGLGLCALHGRGEHERGTTDVRARWWNVLFLNDGHHGAHHAAPGRHYTELPLHASPATRTSCLPPVLRLDGLLSAAPWLDAAERLVLASPRLRRAVLAAHRRALARLVAPLPAVRRVVVVGGGLFPRTAILLRELLPHARIVVLDRDAAHLAAAAPWLPAGIATMCGEFTAGARLDADLVVLPLALRGDREACCASPPAQWVLVHDWCWSRRGEGHVVAWWLGKRIYLLGGQRVAAGRAVPA